MKKDKPKRLIERFGPDFLKPSQWEKDQEPCQHCGMVMLLGCGLADPKKCNHQEKTNG